MWWNKKEEEKVEEPKKELVIKKRIKALYDKLSKIHDTKTHEVINIWYWKNVNAFEHKDAWYFGFTLNTIYGERTILINDEYKLYYGKDDFIKYKSYYAHGYECPFYINSMFSLVAKMSVIIKPEPMVEFTPKEIDLAILEFENAIEPIYQEALKRESKHKACIEYFSEVVNEQ